MAVPDGCEPCMEITVEVPRSRSSTRVSRVSVAAEGMMVTEEMYEEAVKKASRMGNKPDPDILRWALNTYCANNGNIEGTFAAMGDDPAEALAKPTYCDTPEKFAANYVLGYFKVRR